MFESSRMYVSPSTLPQIRNPGISANFNSREQEESEVNKTLKVMVDGYEKIPFPQIRSDFSDTIIYWRRDEEVLVLDKTIPTEEEKTEPLPAEADTSESTPIEEPKVAEETKPEELKIEESSNPVEQITKSVKEESIESPGAQLLSEAKAAETKSAAEEKTSEPDSTGGVKL